MPKAKPSARKKPTKKKTSARRPVRAKKTRASIRAPKESYSSEYADYLERYTLYGAGRPRLDPAEFDRLDDEMLDLLGLESEQGLNDEQIVRLQELEYLLLDSEQ
jgi:hypothetical protein